MAKYGVCSHPIYIGLAFFFFIRDLYLICNLISPQVLLAEELTQVNIGTFGWSLAAGEDLDGNEYPDLAVGAYDSNKVAVFRTRPVVQVKSEIR